MPSSELLKVLRKGSDAWNRWRAHRPLLTQPNLDGISLQRLSLEGVNLQGANLIGTDLSGANLAGADLSNTNLTNAKLLECRLENSKLVNAKGSNTMFYDANLDGADLTESNFIESQMDGASFRRATLEGAMLVKASMSKVDLQNANLRSANLSMAAITNADLRYADFEESFLVSADLSFSNASGANFRRAFLTSVRLVESDLSDATISECHVYGISAWNLNLDRAKQDGLIISENADPFKLRVDDLEVAQFVFLLLNHRKLRNVLNAVTRRGVLLLGRFGGGGIEVLQAIAARLRELEYLPIIFDFERPDDRNLTETIKTLVGMSRFVIADLSGPSVPQELYATVPHFKVPFALISEEGRRPHSMSNDLVEYPWVIGPPIVYSNVEHLLAQLSASVITPVEERLVERRARLNDLFGAM
ncbi:pentapeptide repeat-containing protein [Longimicrobium sp.]|uniref:pentapeptide repeat-containing protein n=1 Tax=Longimicrobium sp. TaxID=2029185 RepID=UPI003B3BB6A7